MSLNSQNKVTTQGDNSPAVITKNLSVTYGVRPEAILAILSMYDNEEYNVKERIKATETILEVYSKSPEVKNNSSELSSATKSKLGIQNNSKIQDALEWDLYAKSNNLSTLGNNSPAVIASGEVKIWYGIPVKTFKSISSYLEKNKKTTENFELQLKNSVENFHKLKKELEFYSGREKIYAQAKNLIFEGKLDEANQLIESDYVASKKRQAYKGYIYGLTKELLNDFREAKVGYKDASTLDDSNTFYLLKYGEMLKNLDQSKDALAPIKQAYNLLPELESKINKEEYISLKSTILNQLGVNNFQIDNVDKAILYHEEAKTFIEDSYWKDHYLMGMINYNLGRSWAAKKDFDKSLEYYEEANNIYTKYYGEICWDNGDLFILIAISYFSKGDIANAQFYFDKAKSIYLHLSTGRISYRLGLYHYQIGRFKKGLKEYDEALISLKKAEDILTQIFELPHKFIRSCFHEIYSTLWGKGVELMDKREFKDSNFYFKKAHCYAQKVGDNYFSVYCLSNLGNNEFQLNNLEDALAYYNEGLDLISQVQKTASNVQDLEEKRKYLIGSISNCLARLGRQKELIIFLGKQGLLNQSKKD